MPQQPPSNSETPALFPEAVFSARQRSARYIPANYLPAEQDEARRVMEHWNETFRGVAGAPICQLGNASNIRVYVQFRRRLQKSEQPEFVAIGEAKIKQAIDRYRQDPANVKFGRWKHFRDWLDAEKIVSLLNRGTNAPARPADQRRAASAGAGRNNASGEPAGHDRRDAVTTARTPRVITP